MVGAGEDASLAPPDTAHSRSSRGTSALSKASGSRPATAPRHPDVWRDAILLIAGVADPARPSGLCESARAILADADTDLLACDVSALVRPDVGTVDELARLALVARELGGEVVLLDAAAELRELVDLAGLGDVLPVVARSVVESHG